MKNSSDILKILIPAVGGQGGGVLTEWLVNAFLKSGYDVQGISLPGLSQRAGSTVYYIETYKSGDGDKQYIFSQYPLPGDVDIILCQEFLELGRVLEHGYGSDKTTIISSKHRIYSTLEKLPIASGIFSREKLERIAHEFSSTFIGIDALQIAKDNNMDDLAVNAILFGALAASKSVPLSIETLKSAIEQTGIAVKNNIIAFDIGYNYVRNNSHDIINDKTFNFEKAVEEKLLTIDKKQRDDFLELAGQVKNEYPAKLTEILLESVYRLTDYQDTAYAARYLDNVKRVFLIDKSKGISSYILTEYFSKNLALLMSYEDGIRVAELKTRSMRMQRIRNEMQIREDQLFRVIDYLKPDAYEIYGLFPNFIVIPILKIANLLHFRHLKNGSNKVTFAQKPLTSSFSGFLRLWLLTKIKFLRLYSHRYHNESRIIGKYIESTVMYSKTNYDLGIIVARSGSLVKGYGDVRRRTMDNFIKFTDINVEEASRLIKSKPPETDTIIKDLEDKYNRLSSEPEHV